MDNLIKMTETKKIKEYLSNQDIKIVDLAKKLGDTKQNLGRILNGDDIKMSKLRQIAKALKVPVSTFIDDYDPGIPDKEQIKNELLQDDAFIQRVRASLL